MAGLPVTMPAEVAGLPRLLCHPVTLLRQKLITLYVVLIRVVVIFLLLTLYLSV